MTNKEKYQQIVEILRTVDFDQDTNDSYKLGLSLTDDVIPKFAHILTNMLWLNEGIRGSTDGMAVIMGAVTSIIATANSACGFPSEILGKSLVMGLDYTAGKRDFKNFIIPENKESN